METDEEIRQNAQRFQAALGSRKAIMKSWMESLGLRGDVYSSCSQPLVSQIFLMLETCMVFEDTQLVEMDKDAVEAECHKQLKRGLADLRTQIDCLEQLACE